MKDLVCAESFLRIGHLFGGNMNIGKRQRPFTGNIVVPGDKSISHRALMLGAIADGTTVIENFLMSE